MIHSRVKTFGFSVAVSGAIGGFFAFIYFTTTIINKDLPPDKNEFLGLCFFYLVIVILISMYSKLLWDSNIVCIDTEHKVIYLKNRFTRVETTYDFDFFDGSMVIHEPIKGGYARNFYLIKNRKAVKRMTSFIYSNQKEMEEALTDIKSLDEMPYSRINSAKILFSKPIL